MTIVGGGCWRRLQLGGRKAVPQSVTLTVVGALSFSRWREDKQLVFWVCCAGADNAGCQQSLIFPTATNRSWGRFNRYITMWFMLYPPRSVLLPLFLLGEQRCHTGISCLVSFSYLNKSKLMWKSFSDVTKVIFFNMSLLSAVKITVFFLHNCVTVL